MRNDARKAPDSKNWLWGTGEFRLIDSDLEESGKSVRLELVLQTRGPWAISALSHESRIAGMGAKVFRQTWSAICRVSRGT
jgi:hypothetical protein